MFVYYSSIDVYVVYLCMSRGVRAIEMLDSSDAACIGLNGTVVVLSGGGGP